MRKRNAVRAAAAALAAMMALTACGGGGGNETPEEILAPQQLAEMRQLPAPARLERPISPLPWAQIS